jgi:hypothetical protein
MLQIAAIREPGLCTFNTGLNTTYVNFEDRGKIAKGSITASLDKQRRISNASVFHYSCIEIDIANTTDQGAPFLMA